MNVVNGCFQTRAFVLKIDSDEKRKFPQKNESVCICVVCVYMFNVRYEKCDARRLSCARTGIIRT